MVKDRKTQIRSQIPSDTVDLKFLEFKSITWKKINGKWAFNVGQLKTYLENVTSLSELNYIFNKSTGKLTNPKQFMKEVFQQNAEEIFNANQSLFNKLKLINGDLVDTPTRFEKYLLEINFNNPFFDFVK